MYVYKYTYINRDIDPFSLSSLEIICSYRSWNVEAEDHCILYK